jgi:hypothetical protein
VVRSLGSLTNIILTSSDSPYLDPSPTTVLKRPASSLGMSFHQPKQPTSQLYKHIILPLKMPETITQAIPMLYIDSGLLEQELNQKLGLGSWKCKVS